MDVRFTSFNYKKYFDSRSSFADYFLNGKKGKFLDVGNLGDGPVNIDLRTKIESTGGEYFGLDINANLAEKLKNKNQIIGDLHDLKGKIGDEEFDGVYAGQVIEHTWEPGRIIQECNRILKKDGNLFLDTPNSYDILGILRFFLKQRDTIGAGRFLTYSEAKDSFSVLRLEKGELYTQPQHKIFYSPAMLEQLLTMHGFKIVEIVFIGKPKNIFHKTFLKVFPQGSQKIGVIAKKETLENIFEIVN